MNITYILVTAIAVSADSMLAGFSVSLNKRKSLTLPVVVTLITFIMCVATMLLGRTVHGTFNENAVNLLGAGILAAVGVANLFKKEENALTFGRISLKESVAVGVAVGLDAAVAEFSVTLMGFDGIAVPIVFALFHYAAVCMGMFLAKKMPNLGAKWVSGALLIALAVLKLF